MIKITASFIAAMAMTTAVSAEEWVLNSDASRLAFGSIKMDQIGEIHSFPGLSGTVAKDGSVNVEIDLSSVETSIPIRNERMVEFVFKQAPTASLSATVDMGALEKLPVGEMEAVDVKGKLSFLGKEMNVSTKMLAARLSDERVMVTTNDMIFLPTQALGIDEGISKLRDIAQLPSITRAVPITIRLVFDESDISS